MDCRKYFLVTLLCRAYRKPYGRHKNHKSDSFLSKMRKSICKWYASIIISCACMSSRLPRSWGSWIYAYFTVFPNVKHCPTCYNIYSTDPSRCNQPKQYTSFIFLWKASKLKSINRNIYFAFNSNSYAIN